LVHLSCPHRPVGSNERIILSETLCGNLNVKQAFQKHHILFAGVEYVPAETCCVYATYSTISNLILRLRSMYSTVVTQYLPKSSLLGWLKQSTSISTQKFNGDLKTCQYKRNQLAETTWPDIPIKYLLR
jgi:hypothetical protein